MGVYITRQGSYIVVLKEYSIEFFYDAGNPVGSPLAPVPGASISIGCASASTVAQTGGEIFFVGHTSKGGIGVYRIQGLKHELISPEAVNRLIEAVDPTDRLTGTLTQFNGHRFYILTMADVGNEENETIEDFTLAIDTQTGYWFFLTDTNGESLPFVSSAFNVESTGTEVTFLQHATDGGIYGFVNGTLDDPNNQPILFDLVTPNFDAGTRKKKFLHTMDIVADQVTDNYLWVRYSEDDYQTWSDWRYVNMGEIRPKLTQCGTFRRRAYQFHHEDMKPLRLQAAELQMDVGLL
jgi:hypothetical protein